MWKYTVLTPVSNPLFMYIIPILSVQSMKVSSLNICTFHLSDLTWDIPTWLYLRSHTWVQKLCLSISISAHTHTYVYVYKGSRQSTLPDFQHNEITQDLWLWVNFLGFEEFLHRQRSRFWPFYILLEVTRVSFYPCTIFQFTRVNFPFWNLLKS